MIFCQVFTISLLFFAWNFVIRSNPPFSDDGRWATAQSFIRKEITSYRIGSLVDKFEFTLENFAAFLNLYVWPESFLLNCFIYQAKFTGPRMKNNLGQTSDHTNSGKKWMIVKYHQIISYIASPLSHQLLQKRFSKLTLQLCQTNKRKHQDLVLPG